MEPLHLPFDLRDVADIRRDEPEPSLGWYVLTDGRYDVRIDGRSAFGVGSSSNDSGVPYYVARLWEDLTTIAPAIDEEIPDDLFGELAELGRWTTWLGRVDDVVYDTSNWDLRESALSWWDERWLDSSYLVDGPTVGFFRNAGRTTMLISAPNRISSALRFECSSNAVATAIQGLDSELISKMKGRVDRVADDASLPADVREELHREHDQRAKQFQRQRDAFRPTDWTRVRDSMTALRELLASQPQV